MSILDREREIAHTQNQIKHSTCTVYTASPEELEKLLNGRNGMGRTKGSKNKPHDITINEKRQALQNKIEKQKSERKEKEALNNGAFDNVYETHELEGVIGKSSESAGNQIIPIVDKQPEACLVPEEVKSDTVESTEESVIHKQCMEMLKGQYKTACSCAAYRLLSDELVKMSAESAVEVLSNIIEVSILFRKEILSIGAAK